MQEVVSDGMVVGACDEVVELGCRDDCYIEDVRVVHVERVKT